jgi:hypothetical protein
MDLDPFHSLRTVDVQKLQNLDEETRRRFLVLLENIEEPDWRESLTRLFSFLKRLDRNLSGYDENAVMRVSSVRELIGQILTDPDAASGAFIFLEQSSRAMDIIALEQLMMPDPENPS